MANNKSPKKSETILVFGAGFGGAFGAVLAAVFESIDMGLGIALGIAFGVTIALVFGKKIVELFGNPDNTGSNEDKE